jgi:hypothetical protein
MAAIKNLDAKYVSPSTRQNQKEPNVKNNEERRLRAADQKEQWQSMKIDYVGNVGELVLGGTGKVSTSPADPGEARKPIGQGN